MHDPNCIFCKIASGAIPAGKIYEDENFVAILDISPASEGHTLLIPKAHVQDVYDLPEAVGKEIYPVLTKLSHALKRNFAFDGLNILQNNGEVAGQTVFHFHIHLIPRHTGDTVAVKWDAVNVSPERMKEILDNFK